ncbi:MAG: hypothetical protein FWG05_04845 [Kiritimatiellaeota bacterium]|nr:hypothetical protein [Kiritimatiellota bacterium]
MFKHPAIIAAAAIAALTAPVFADAPHTAEAKALRVAQDEWFTDGSFKSGSANPLSTVYAEKIALSIAKSFAKHGNVTTDRPLYLTQNRQPYPIAIWPSPDAKELDIRVHCFATFWGQLVYQYAHEYCHMFSQYWNFGGGDGRWTAENPSLSHSNMWFQEALCELASIWALNYVAEDWDNDESIRPFAHWTTEGERMLKSYYRDHVKKFQKFDTPEAFAAWMQSNIPGLKKGSRDLNSVVAVQLLPLFLEKPRTWEVFPYMNCGGQDKDQTFRNHLRAWHKAAPDDMKHHVVNIANRVGYPLDGDDSQDNIFPKDRSLKPIRIDQAEWKEGVANEFPLAVMTSAAKMFAEFGKIVTDNPVAVAQADGPTAWFGLHGNNEHTMKVSATGTSWAWLTFQFNDGYTQFLVKFDVSYGHKNQWVTDVLRRAAGMWCMDKMGDEWTAGCGPYAHWSDYGVHLKSYAADHLKGLDGDFGKNVNKITVLFKANPEYIEAIEYANEGLDKDAETQAYFQNWHDKAPARLRPAVVKIAAEFGIAVK